MSGQVDMFEPERQEALSQWFTPAWIARRAARWLRPGLRILEPSVGSGNLVEALVRAGHRIEDITGCEIDPAWEAHTHARFDRKLEIYGGDFLAIDWSPPRPRFDASFQNPPYENDLDLRFVVRTLEIAPITVAIVKSDFEFGTTRDAGLWLPHGVVRRRAILVERPRFGSVSGSTGNAERNYVVLEIVRRHEPRAPGAQATVIEERWLSTDPEESWSGPLAEAA